MADILRHNIYIEEIGEKMACCCARVSKYFFFQKPLFIIRRVIGVTCVYDVRNRFVPLRHTVYSVHIA